MDFEEIEAKCTSNQYRIVDEFRADCQLMVHNVVIFHGGIHTIYFILMIMYYKFELTDDWVNKYIVF